MDVTPQAMLRMLRSGFRCRTRAERVLVREWLTGLGWKTDNSWGETWWDPDTQHPVDWSLDGAARMASVRMAHRMLLQRGWGGPGREEGYGGTGRGGEWLPYGISAMLPPGSEVFSAAKSLRSAFQYEFLEAP